MKTSTICPNCHLSLPAETEQCPQCDQEFCIYCSAPIANDALSCTSCGQEFELFCPQCDRQVTASAASCPECGLSFSQDLESSDQSIEGFITDAGDEDRAQCSTCGDLYYTDDFFCRECGQVFCPNCGEGIDDEDDQCPNCQIKLTLDCPLCGFNLTIGTEICPNCDALFPKHCPGCLVQITAGLTSCPHCFMNIEVIQRKSARTVKTLEIGGGLIRVVACPGCGHDFDPISGKCPTCGLRLCSQCQLVLCEGEQGCPRCGIPLDIVEDDTVCGYCQSVINFDTGECPTCQLVHCPECMSMIPEISESCSTCGVQFEFLCPHCDLVVSSDAEICHNCGANI